MHLPIKKETNMASLFLLSILASVFTISSALTTTCSNHTFSSNTLFTSCTDLPHLQAHLHWNYNPTLRKVSIAYRAHQVPDGWIAWGINPTGTGMVGSQTLVAFRRANGTMTVYPTSIASYNPPMLPAPLTFQVSNVSAEYKDNEMTIYAVIGPLQNGTVVNHVWQAGSSVANNVPQMHSTSPPHLKSTGRIDFHSGSEAYN